MTFQPGIGSRLQKRRSGLFCDSVRQVVVFLSLRFLPVRLSKFADNDVFGGFVDEKDVGFEL
jgi:hypothetical protein